MDIGIIGLPKSGKTTVFNALTKGKAETTAYSTALLPNIGIAKVEDKRLSGLAAIFKPRKIVPAEIKFVDIAVSKGSGKEEGQGRQLTAYLSTVDALLQVVRTFEDERIPHSEGSLNPERDIATVNLELTFSDLVVVEKRLERIGNSLKAAKPAERDKLLKEEALLKKIMPALEGEIPLREQGLSPEEIRALENYQFLTVKPVILVFNIGEEQISQATAVEQTLAAHYPQLPACALCGKLEMELDQLGEAEAKEFRSTWNLTGAATERLIELSFRSLGLIHFFTTASREVKAWTIHLNTSAPEAAGKIHSDMQKGFIRAEVIGYDDLMKCGGFAEARKRGMLRLEGKAYTVQDGDVINFLFSV